MTEADRLRALVKQWRKLAQDRRYRVRVGFQGTGISVSSERLIGEADALEYAATQLLALLDGP